MNIVHLKLSAKILVLFCALILATLYADAPRSRCPDENNRYKQFSNRGATKATRPLE